LRLGIVLLVPMLVNPASPTTAAESATPTKIAVFDFELDDHSAGGGIIPEDAVDRAYLKQSTDEAKRQLLASVRFTIVDTASVAPEVTAGPA
jgi:hypothetical protein